MKSVLNRTGVNGALGFWKFPTNRWVDVPDEIADKICVIEGMEDDDSPEWRYRENEVLHLGWCSPIHYADGYGSIAQEIAAEFLAMGVRLSIYPKHYDPSHRNFGNIPLNRWEAEAFVPRSIVEQLASGSNVPTLYGVNMTWPAAVDDRPFPRCLGFTMFETTRPPLDWARRMNAVRRILVPCQQNKEAFEGIGVRTPIHVVPLGVDGDRWSVPDRTANDGPFTFLMSAGLTHRKNPLGAVRAFLSAFPPVRQDVRFILKTRGAHAGGFREWIKDLPQDDRIEVVCEESTPDQMVEWMHRADAFVFPSRGEGFGLTPLQAMATGLPTIVSDNSGMSEYCDDRYNWPVPCREVKVPDGSHGGYPDHWGDCGDWWEPSHEALVEAMRDVERNRVGASAKADQGASWVRREWSITRVCERILDVIAEDAGAS